MRHGESVNGSNQTHDDFPQRGEDVPSEIRRLQRPGHPRRILVVGPGCCYRLVYFHRRRLEHRFLFRSGLRSLCDDIQPGGHPAGTARRLHDIGKSGWWQLAWVAISLLALIPIVVGLVVSISSDGFAFNLPSGDEGSFLPLLLGFAITLLIWLGVFIWSLIWLISQGQAGPNRYGPDPRASDPTAQEELP